MQRRLAALLVGGCFRVSSVHKDIFECGGSRIRKSRYAKGVVRGVLALREREEEEEASKTVSEGPVWHA
jgi:hypothetical protein